MGIAQPAEDELALDHVGDALAFVRIDVRL